ncbi:hypothetical protein DOJK_02162 [Patescibacteria group bacterium]|nr:hypothetical protein DOJK_02162 [Patescibacteria group bacterium]
MSHWLLLKNPDETAISIPLIPAKRVIGYGVNQYSFDISLKPDKSDSLYHSAKLGGQQGFELLWREGYIRQSVTARFELDVPPNVHGNSADLLFALAVITHIMKDINYPSFAATGCLNEKGIVGSVKGVPEKLNTALNTLPSESIIFYPKANDAEINSTLRQKAEVSKIALHPIERLDQAVSYLGINITKVYLKSPYRGLEAFHAEHRSI